MTCRIKHDPGVIAPFSRFKRGKIMKIHEECGVFGVMTKEPSDVAKLCYFGLYALQHRGQESCGIVVNEDGLFRSHKDLGLVNEVFTKETLSRLPRGTIAVAHARYGTTGATSRRNCQPIEVNHRMGHMAIAQSSNSAARSSTRPATQRRLPTL